MAGLTAKTLLLDVSECGFSTAASVSIVLRRATSTDSFSIIPSDFKITVDLSIDDSVALIATTHGSVYEFSLFNQDKILLSRFLTEMPDEDALLSDLVKVTSWPNVLQGVNPLKMVNLIDLDTSSNSQGRFLTEMPPDESGAKRFGFRQIEVVLSAKDYGAIADGTLHQLSSVYDTLAQAQVVYPQAVSLNQSIDGLAVEKAALLNEGKTIYLPNGLVFNYPILVTKTVNFVGDGMGDTNIPHRVNGIPTWTVVGNGAAFRTVQTRRLYRGSALDPTDDPISMVFNVQQAGVKFEDVWGHCVGTNWDVQIFSGTRRQVRVVNYSLTGSVDGTTPTMIQKSHIYFDGSGATNLTPFAHWDGRAYPLLAVSGADGCEALGGRSWGGCWDVVALGGHPKAGLRTYGRDLVASIRITMTSLPAEGDTITLGSVVFTFRDPLSEVVYARPVMIRDTIAATVIELETAAVAAVSTDVDEDVYLSPFESGYYLADGADLLVFRRSIRPIDPLTDPFLTTWTALTSVPSKFTIPNGGVPQVIADPAPYYDDVLGLVSDQRTANGMSDMRICDNTLSGADTEDNSWIAGYRRNDNNWSAEGFASGNVWVSGLANTGTRTLGKIYLERNRVSSPRQIFSIRLGYVSNILITKNDPDGFSARPVATNSYLLYRYSYITSLPRITVKKTLVAQASVWDASQFNLTEVGDCLLGDHNGNVRSVSEIAGRRLIADARGRFKGSAEMRMFAGSQGRASAVGYKSDGTAMWSLTGDELTGLVEIKSRFTVNPQINIFNARILLEDTLTLTQSRQLAFRRVSNTAIKIALRGTDGTVRESANIDLSATPPLSSGVRLTKLEQLRPCVIATRGHFPVRTNAVASGDRQETEIFVRTGVAAATNLRLVYANVTSSTGAELFEAGSSCPFILESSVLAAGAYTPASYAGVRRQSLDLGASLVVSDEIGLYIAPNTEFSVKTGMVVSAAGTAVASCRSTTRVTKVTSTVGTSQIFTNSAVTTPSGGSALGYALTPLAIIGIPDRPMVSVAFLGTSIDIGQGDTADATTGNLGHLERACISVNGFPLPFVNMSRDGGQSTSYALSNSRFSMMRYVSHVVFGMHTNDIAAGVTLATLQTNVLRAISRARALGCKVYYTTVPPRTTSTDGWATTANQTPVAGFAVGGVADQFNTWLFTQVTAGVLDGVIDTRPATNDPTFPDRWLPSSTTDGTHPNATRHAGMAVIDNAVFATWTV